ncbi:MAG: sensor histidine kinase [Treponema sp.]|jgi:two-component system sensor histidine kinase YesM|nr:sensor histidine kinase [Treponema sp.]
MLKNWTLRFKIIFPVVIYILLIGIIGNVFLYIYLLDAVSQKGERLDRAHLEAVRIQITQNLADVFSLAMVCANNPAVSQAVSRQERAGQEFIRDSLNAQAQLNAFLQANPINAYIDKLILFDNQGLFVQAMSRQGGDYSDLDNIQELPLYSRFIMEKLPRANGFGHSISPENRRDSYSVLLRVRGAYYNSPGGYLYVEAGLDIITAVFREYSVSPGVFAQVPETGEVILQDKPRLIKAHAESLGHVPADVSFPYRFRQGRQSYRLDQLALEGGALVLYNQMDVTRLAVDDRQILYTVLAAVLMSLFAAAALGLTLSAFLTRPIQILINRIHKISEDKDFSEDPEIEKPGDEIGLIGRTVNEMSGSIRLFLAKMEEHYREQKNAEIALLQTQINPHFLYNTLDSIQWMAKIQNNPAIAGITRRLINLLRSIARPDTGGDAKITLAEELRILEDYTKLMSVRFMGSFEVVNRIPETFLNCRIPKLTLQPLVENAILHGIEPSGRFGIITLNAVGEGEYLDITVEDTGIGMSREQLGNIKIQNRAKERGSPSLNNIGIVNVDERLKLLYGESCGLFFESKEGAFTRVRVKILAER